MIIFISNHILIENNLMEYMLFEQFVSKQKKNVFLPSISDVPKNVVTQQNK